MIRILFCLLLCSGTCFASSVRLINDSPHKLRAVIRGNDGSNLGEMMVEPDQATTWNDQYSRTGELQKGNIYQNQPWRSQTPYTVLWYCEDGSDFAFCSSVNTGNPVAAKSCDGARQCKLKKKNPNSTEHEQFFEKEAKKE